MDFRKLLKSIFFVFHRGDTTREYDPPDTACRDALAKSKKKRSQKISETF